MKKPWYRIQKAYYPIFVYKREKSRFSSKEYEHGRGFYISIYGDAVSIYHETAHGNFKDFTSFEMRVNGLEHYKTYERVFTDRGLQKVAAAFIYFVHQETFKPHE